MPAFHSNYDPSEGVTSLKLHRGFKEEDWKELIDFYKSKVTKGSQNWELDLTDVDYISSNSIGMLIALNTSIMANTGTLRVILSKKSNLTNQIRFARIDQILNCVYS